MTVRELCEICEFRALNLTDDEIAVTGAYAGDLLSWVMGRAKSGDAILTIMTNLNVVAVAALVEASCVIFCEGLEVDENLIAAAKEKNINLLLSPLPTFETCAKLSNLFL